jgi:hypothetical protein
MNPASIVSKTNIGLLAKKNINMIILSVIPSTSGRSSIFG